MVGGGTTEVSSEVLAKLTRSTYQRWAERYYGHHHPTTPLYIEVCRDGTIIASDPWEYSRRPEFDDGFKTKAFAVTNVPRDRWWLELAEVICFARRVRQQYGWYVVPCFAGHELKVKDNDQLQREMQERARALMKQYCR